MDNTNICNLCANEDVLYNCACGKLFCIYHKHILLHQCPLKYLISYNDICYVCNKKILIICKCHCGGIFCLKHRYPDSHRCTFNHKSFEREILIKSLPLVEKDKVTNRIK